MQQLITPGANQKKSRAEEHVNTKTNHVIHTTPTQSQKISNKLENASTVEDHFPTMEEGMHAQLVE